MTTISGVGLQQLYGYGAQPSVGAKPSVADTAQAAKSATVDGVLATLENGKSSPLTYNSAGLFASAPPQGGAATSQQAAQNAVLAAEKAVSDTLASLSSGSSSSQQNSSALDIPALLGSPGTLNAGTPGSNTVQTAQDTLAAVQNVITGTLNSLGSGSSSGSTGAA